MFCIENFEYVWYTISFSTQSGTKRWLSTGLFGLASSDVGKTMKCKNCGYKW